MSTRSVARSDWNQPVAYGFIGVFAIGSLAMLAISIGSTVQRATLIFTGSRADATVVAKSRSRNTSDEGVYAYAPVVQFVASDGRTYVVTSDLHGPESTYRIGQRVRILYPPDRPNGARIDAFGQLWTLPLVTGFCGAALSILPSVVVAKLRRRRRTVLGGALPDETVQGPGRLTRWALGSGLIVCGLVILASVGWGPPNPAAVTAVEARILGISAGVLLAASGLLIGQWVELGSRVFHTLGALVMTSFAIIFGGVAIFGRGSGFSAGAGGGVTAARIAFGCISVLTGLASLGPWKQVLRRRS